MGKRTMMVNIQCIYCKEDKPESAYKKADHVVPQSFGKFSNNFTLLRLVCDVCNQFFGDHIELALARDSLEGQSRADCGVKKPEDFKSPGCQSRIRIKIAEGNFKGAYAYRDYSEADGKVTLQPVPQIGFRQKDLGEYKYFLLNELPEKDELEELGFNLQDNKSIRAVGLGVEELSKRLAEKGIPLRYEGDVVPENEYESLLCEVKGTIDYAIFRATAKIAFNYLTYWMGGDFVRQVPFDEVRNFIRHGTVAPYPLVKVGQQPILADEGAKRRMGHLVTVNWAGDGVSIIAQVSLLNLFTYSICLARNYGDERMNIVRGHFFNIYDGNILALGTKTIAG